MRVQSKARNADIYPSYKSITEAKVECYPNNILVSDNEASVPLQYLLDHTSRRLMETLNISQLQQASEKLICIYKWGSDGASGQGQYAQLGKDGSHIKDSSIFMVSLVPLRIIRISDSVVVWCNNRPSSTSYCRPISFNFATETKELIMATSTNLNTQIQKLRNTAIKINGITYSIQHELHETMIDGKVCQVLTKTPSCSTWVICGCTPKNMNKLDVIKKK